MPEGKMLPDEFNTPSINKNIIRALFLLTISDFASFKLKFILISSIPKIYAIVGFKGLINKIIEENKKVILEMEADPENNLLDQYTEAVINKQFMPSKTAQNGLAFVTKEEEIGLCKREQPEEIANIFRLIYHMVDEKMDEFETSQKMIDNFFTNVLPKLKVDNLSKLFYNILEALFLQHIAKNTEISEERYLLIAEIIKNNPRILSSNDLLKLNRSVSYMSFIIKEVYEFYSLKNPQGVLGLRLRIIKKKYDKIKENNEKLKSLL